MFRILPIVLMVCLFFIPDLVGAADPEGFVNCDGTDCTACNVVDMANKMIIFLFGIIGMIFAVLMMIAGFGLVTSGGNTSALEAAKSKFKNAIIGLIIVMGAWLAVDTLMRGVLPVKIDPATGESTAWIEGWGPWADVQCVDQAITKPWSRSGKDAIDATIVTPATPAVAAGSLTHAAAVAQLGSAFTISSSGGCTDRTKSSCTSLDGVKTNTIARLKEFQSAVGIPLVISGGTEVGHAAGTYSHANGYKIDLRIDPALNSYITTNFTSLGGSKWKDGNGNIFYRHGPPDHWDITITK